MKKNSKKEYEKVFKSSLRGILKGKGPGSFSRIKKKP